MGYRQEGNLWTVPMHREPLRDVEAKANPQHTALVVIDMQNDFCADGGMMSQEGAALDEVQAMAERLPLLLDSARAASVLVVFVRNIYSTIANHYLSDSWLESASRRFSGKSYTVREACPPDSWKTEFFGDVQPLPDEPIVTKHRYNAFHGTDLDLILRTHGIRTLVTTGVASNVCVETTARDGFVRDYYILFPRDGTATWSLAAHEATLRNIDLFFGEVTTIDDLSKVWKQYEGRDQALSLAKASQRQSK
jgi:ureidoacrylate peracid hydrolase